MTEKEKGVCPTCGKALSNETSNDEAGENKKILSQASVPKPKGGMKFSDSWISTMLGTIIALIVVLGLCRGCSWVESYDWTCEQNRKAPPSLKERIDALKNGRFVHSYGKKPFYCDKFVPKKTKPPIVLAPPPACTSLDPKEPSCWEDILKDWEKMRDGGACPLSSQSSTPSPAPSSSASKPHEQ